MKLFVFAGLASVVLATPAAAQSWQVVARSDARTYLVNVAELVVAEDKTTALVAVVPRQGQGGDYSYSVDTYELQCTPKRWRIASVAEHGADGAQADVFPEPDGTWDDIRPRGQPELIKLIACDGQRTQGQAFASVRAYIDAGRP